MEPMRLDRRAALVRLGWLGWAWVGTLWGAPAPGRAAVSRTASPHWLRHGASAAVLGAEYLRRRPIEAHLPALRERLGLPEREFASPADHPKHRARLAAQHREDFRVGRVFDLEGWTLSQTELRLSALAYLESAAARD